MSLLVLKLRYRVLRQYIGSDTVHDIGVLTFTFNCFWAYIAFSQYFLIWYGNIPEETIWFLHRWTGTDQPATWWPLALLFPTGMFVLPFLSAADEREHEAQRAHARHHVHHHARIAFPADLLDR